MRKARVQAGKARAATRGKAGRPAPARSGRRPAMAWLGFVVPPQGQKTTLKPFDRLKPAPPAAALRYQNWKFQVWPAEMGAGAVG